MSQIRKHRLILQGRKRKSDDFKTHTCKSRVRTVHDEQFGSNLLFFSPYIITEPPDPPHIPWRFFFIFPLTVLILSKIPDLSECSKKSQKHIYKIQSLTRM